MINRQATRVGISDFWYSLGSGAWRLDRLRQAAVTRTVAPGTASAWRCRLFRQAVVADFVNLRRLAPGGTCPPPGGLEAVAPSGVKPDSYTHLDVYKRQLLSCGSGWRMDTRNPGVVARVGECGRYECAGSGQYGWVQIDCPPQLLADEFGSLGTIRTLFVCGTSTWRCGV
ncbi:hypothetical protein DEO72_LG2g3444 [Vigna unguiculata]|uniref:Uncharacterized protein n=1 Tax=Vigna unguiculata TaxID=3917 RepID=A0A4D6L3L5_VIGUN|nr:hypothetical protein DEO72_LG2g3444 [Vigna unguiculata]